MEAARLMGAQEVADYLGISKPYAYKIMRRLNRELEASGHMVIAGRISRDYLDEAFFGVPRKGGAVNGGL